MTQTDLPRTIAALIGFGVPDGSMRDSEDVSDALLGLSDKGRDEIIEESGWGDAKGYRCGDWKFTSGKSPRLHDLASDPGETRNLASDRPDLVERFSRRLAELTE